MNKTANAKKMNQTDRAISINSILSANKSLAFLNLAPSYIPICTTPHTYMYYTICSLFIKGDRVWTHKRTTSLVIWAFMQAKSRQPGYIITEAQNNGLEEQPSISTSRIRIAQLATILSIGIANATHSRNKDTAVWNHPSIHLHSILLLRKKKGEKNGLTEQAFSVHLWWCPGGEAQRRKAGTWWSSKQMPKSQTPLTTLVEGFKQSHSLPSKPIKAAHPRLCKSKTGRHKCECPSLNPHRRWGNWNWRPGATQELARTLDCRWSWALN